VWIPDIVPYNGEQIRPNFITVNDNIPNVSHFWIDFFANIIEGTYNSAKQHNFILINSKFLDCPDVHRRYHFRPAGHTEILLPNQLRKLALGRAGIKLLARLCLVR
jgi:hypothetical protein